MKTIEHDDITVVDGEYGFEESDQSKAFNDFRDKFKDEQMGTLRVHRVPVTNKTTNAAKLRTVYLFSCPIDAFSFEDLLEHIRDNYGGGTFRLIGTREGQRGNSFNKLVEIEAPQKKFNIPGTEETVGVSAGGNPAELINQFGAVLLEHSTRIEEMMRGSAQPMGDPLDQMTKVMNSLGTVIETMGFKQQQPKSLVDQLTEFKMLQELFAGGEGDGGEANLYSLLQETVKSFGGPLMQAVALAQEQGKISPDGVMQPPALPAPEAPPVNASEQGGSMNLQEMREQLEFLVIQAGNDVDHGMVADFIIEHMPDEDAAYDAFERFLQDEKCLDRCAMIQPKVNDHRDWFLAWREVMLVKLDEMIESGESMNDAKSLTKGDDKTDDAPTDAGDPKVTESPPEALDNATKPKDRDPVNPDGDT